MKLYQHFKGGLYVVMSEDTLDASVDTYDATAKYVMAMGACTIGGGPYFKHGYHVVKGVDLVVPVDIYIPGCPPRPESLLEGLMRLQDKIRHETRAKGVLTKAKEATYN